MSICVIASTWWPEEATGQCCFDYMSSRHILSTYSNWAGLVTDQQSCMQQCEMDSDCIGIIYSERSAFVDWCFICTCESRELDTFGFGFYRNPGKNVTCTQKPNGFSY